MKLLPPFARSLAVALALASASTTFAEKPAPIRVALYDDAGAAGKGVPNTNDILTKAGCRVTIFKAGDIATGAFENKDVVVFTGGSGSKEAETIGDAGREAVKKFVQEGHGYLGICAGAYLACSKFSWGLGILDAQTVSSKWRRGSGDVEIEITPAGEKLTTVPAARHTIHYGNGPILKPAGRTDLAPYEPLAFYRTELAEHDTPVGAMVNTPAIVRGQFGKGRVLISSPHPEQTPGLEIVVERAVKWLAAGDQP